MKVSLFQLWLNLDKFICQFYICKRFEWYNKGYKLLRTVVWIIWISFDKMSIIVLFITAFSILKITMKCNGWWQVFQRSCFQLVCIVKIVYIFWMFFQVFSASRYLSFISFCYLKHVHRNCWIVNVFQSIWNYEFYVWFETLEYLMNVVTF